MSGCRICDETISQLGKELIMFQNLKSIKLLLSSNQIVHGSSLINLTNFMKFNPTLQSIELNFSNQ